MFARDEGNAATGARSAGLALPFATIDILPAPMSKPQDPPAGGPNLRALTRAVRRGDAEAFSRFYDLYSFRLYKYPFVLAQGDENQAKEVCQAVLIKLTKRFKVFDDERQLWAWLTTLTRNAFIDHCRAQQRRNRLVSLDALPAAVGIERDPEHRLAELLRENLASLPPEERELIQAAYVDERPLQELADESGQTYKALESRLGRLRYKLKERLLENLRHENRT